MTFRRRYFFLLALLAPGCSGEQLVDDLSVPNDFSQGSGDLGVAPFDLTGLDLTGLDLTGLDLTGFDLAPSPDLGGQSPDLQQSPDLLQGSPDLLQGAPDLLQGSPDLATTALTLSFGTGSSYAVGKNPISVAVGDFDKNGKIDVAVANFGSNSVSVLLNGGAAAFASAVPYGVGVKPFAVAAVDMNKDGILDLVTANYNTASNGDGDVSVLIGNGDGTFKAVKGYPTGLTGSNSLVVTDLNKDGNPDVAVANDGDAIVSVQAGTATGALGGISYPAVGMVPDGVAAGDFDSDGNIDLVAANNQDNTVSVLLGNGNLTFKTAATYGTGGGAFGVATGHFDGDSVLDLVVANGTSLGILLGNANGTFKTATQIAVTGSYVSLGDFDRDGNTDLLVAAHGNVARVLLGTGKGTFGAAKDFAAGTYVAGIVAGDFNGDNLPDVATANYNSNDVTILLNTSK
jgi:hypothetical protein